MTKKQELRKFINAGAPTKQKIYRKPKIYGPDKKSQEKNQLKESFGGQGV